MAKSKKITISALHIHPIKSCAGISVESWPYTSEGLFLDRQFMIADARTHTFLTARTISRMILIKPSVDLASPVPSLTISIPAYNEFPASTHTIPLDPPADAPSSCDFRVWSSPAVTGFEVGTPELIEALSNYMGKEVKLIKKGNDKRIAGPKDGWVEMVGQKMGIKTLSKEEEQPIVGFADAFPFLLTSRDSIADVNKLLGEEWVRKKTGFDEERWGDIQKSGQGLEIERFRGNIIIEGGEPWEEDGWGEIKIRDSKCPEKETVMFVMLRCARCMLPNVDPATGIRDKVVPDQVLRPYREGTWSFEANKVFFGVNITPYESVGSLTIGSTIEVVTRFDKKDTANNHEYHRPEDTDLDLLGALA